MGLESSGIVGMWTNLREFLESDVPETEGRLVDVVFERISDPHAHFVAGSDQVFVAFQSQIEPFWMHVIGYLGYACASRSNAACVKSYYNNIQVMVLKDMTVIVLPPM